MREPVDPKIEFLCDEHVTADPVGPFVTRHEGTWAYCAGYGESGHRWRRIAPTARAVLESDDREGHKAAG